MPLAYDRNVLNLTKESGTRKRCDVLFNLAERIAARTFEKHSITFFSQAGFTKETPGKPNDKVKIPLCDQMRDYIVRQRPSFIFHTTPQAWGTYEELRYTMQQAKSYGQKEKQNYFYTSTNLGHSLRVWLCIFFLRNELGMWNGWKFRVLLADHSFTKKEWAQETVKLFVYLYRLIFKKSLAIK